MKYVIIGNSAAGIACVEGIRSIDPAGKITLISDEPYHCYSRPLISYYLAGKIKEEHMKYRSEDFYTTYNVNLKLNKKVSTINCPEDYLTLENGEQLDFDKLLIGTGGRPAIPPVKGINRDNIFTFMTLDDVKKISQKIKNIYSGRAVILGGGLIGLKAAEALNNRGLKVSVVELGDSILNTILNKKAASLVQSHLEKRGITFHLTTTVEEFTGDAEAGTARLNSGIELNYDLAIIAAGVRPNTGVAANTELKVNQGILIDKKMATSVPGIYAAGDVSEGYNSLTETGGVIPIWPSASSQGYTAGQNMAGAEKVYDSGFPRNSIGFYDLPVISAGIVKPPVAANKNYQQQEVFKPEKNIYKKVIINNNKLVGFILINSIAKAGLLTGLMKEQTDIGSVITNIIADSFGYLCFPEEYRKEKIYT